MWIPFYLIISLATMEVVGHIESEPVATEDLCAEVLTNSRDEAKVFIESHLGPKFGLGGGDCKEVEEPGTKL
jgi:hypothetical protein